VRRAFRKGQKVILMEGIPSGGGFTLEKGAVGSVEDYDDCASMVSRYLIKFKFNNNLSYSCYCNENILNGEIDHVRNAKQWRLPLFIGQLQTEEGKAELERRMKKC